MFAAITKPLRAENPPSELEVSRSGIAAAKAMANHHVGESCHQERSAKSATPARLPSRFRVYPRSGGRVPSSLPMRWASAVNRPATITNINGSSKVLSTVTTGSAVSLEKYRLPVVDTATSSRKK